MANNGIEEIITTLYEMVQDAWSLPLGLKSSASFRPGYPS